MTIDVLFYSQIKSSETNNNLAVDPAKADGNQNEIISPLMIILAENLSNYRPQIKTQSTSK